jgi:spore maturation protein B
MTDYIIPVLLLTVSAIAIGRKQDPYGLMLEGASEGLALLKSIVPTLILLLTAVTLLRASGAVELISHTAAPLFQLMGIPPETAILVLVRPISGSAALAVGAELMMTYGPDSLIGQTAAVMLGSTETTFYTVSVYFGAAGIRKTRYTLPAALIADLTGFIMAALWTRVIM